MDPALQSAGEGVGADLASEAGCVLFAIPTLFVPALCHSEGAERPRNLNAHMAGKKDGEYAPRKTP